MAKDLEANLPSFRPMATPMELSQANVSKKQLGASVLQLLVISSPCMAIYMAWAAQMAAIGPYLSTMLPSSVVQAIQFIGPTIGALSDRSNSQFGRRRPFLFWAALGSVICFILVGYTREMGEALGDYGDGSDGERQTLGSALGQGWSTLGGILVAGYIEIWGAAYLSLHWFLGMIALMMVVAVGACCFVADETPLEKDSSDTTTTSTRVKHAFASIYYGLTALPYTLVVFSVVFFCVCYGFTAYNGNKGQFFGLEVYGGSSEGAYVASGRADFICSIVGYVFTWMLPFLVKKFGGQVVITASLIPQVLLIALAYTKVSDDVVALVVVVSFTQTTFFAMYVPIIIHVTGKDASIGVYVGAINSASCLGQLLNYIIGTVIGNTPMGYMLLVLVGGIVSALGFFVALLFFRIEMKSM